MSECKRAVYYTSDDDPHCVYRLRKSIESLRRFNQKITVYVAFSGTLSQADKEFLDHHHITLIYNPERVNPYLARFQFLENDFEETELAYLDTDTIAFGDIEDLFERTGPQDFHARQAPLTKREGYPHRLGYQVIFASVINYETFDMIRAAVGVKELPIFNIGVMVFKNSIHRRLAANFHQWKRLLWMFERKCFPYPCFNPYVRREIVTPMALAGIENLTWSFLDPELASFYFEYRVNDTGQGIVMHVLSRYYLAYLLDFPGRDEAKSYIKLPLRSKAHVRKQRLENWFMLIGSSYYRRGYAKALIRLWVRIGGWIYKSRISQAAQIRHGSSLRSEVAWDSKGTKG
jgi:hypothetical protein